MAQPGLIDIDRDGVLDMMKRGAQVVEVLTEKEYQRSHIAGAISIPLGQINRTTADRLDWDRPVILYCFDYQ